jgi:transposase-like protein
MTNAGWIEGLNKLTFVEMVTRFPTEVAAITFLEAVRWQTGPFCFRCGCTDVSRVMSKRARPIWYCRGCETQFSITTGTVMEDTKIPLHKWLLCIHLMCSSKKGVSSLQVHRMLGITRRSAWHLTHRIRHAMGVVSPELLTGTVEVDETYVGGKTRKTGHGYTGNKTAVITVVQRDGSAHSHVIPESMGTKRVAEEVLSHVSRDAILNSDESSIYTNLGKEFAAHDTVNHRTEEYVRRDFVTGRTATANAVEGYFGNLKRQLDGTHHHVGSNHLHRYVKEFEFKYNSRKVTDGVRTVQAVARIEGKRLTLFKNKIGAASLQD